MVAALSGIAMRGIGVLPCIATPQLPSVIAMIRIGPRLIYKNSWIGLNQTASNSRPLWAPVVGTRKEESMAWTTPTLVEICIGLEINGYLPAEF